MSMPQHMDMTAALDMLYLSCCAAAGEPADAERVQRMELAALYRASCSHSLSALVCAALDGIEHPDEGYLKAFRTARDKSVRKNLLLDTERSRLFAFLEEQGIWYMPLKGVLLKDLYPKMGLRQMADNDILFDSAYRETVKAWFDAQGYKTVVYGVSEQDAYEKPPVYNFEMHTALFNELKNETKSAYYRNVKARLVKDEKSAYGYRFTDEDFYIYFISHGCKHYEGSGNGLRFLIDLYIFLKHKPGVAERQYVRDELEKTGLAQFEQRCRALTQRLFCDIQGFDIAQLDAQHRELLEYFLGCGTYGSMEIRVANSVGRMGKFGFVLSRLFPGVAYMKRYMPAVERHRWLLPASWVYRAVVQIPKRYRAIVAELRAIRRTKG